MTQSNPAKFNMIEQQIRPWEVLDPHVLAVFHELDREHFVPDHLKGLAYADCRLPVLKGSSMLPPTLEGRMLQALNIQPSDTVLEIGSCSGYISACLSRLAKRVTSVDFASQAVEMAAHNLSGLGISNVELRAIETLADIKEQSRFDAIALSAGSLSEIPDNLKNALTVGGRLFVVTGQSPVKHACLVTRRGVKEWEQKKLFETDIADL